MGDVQTDGSFNLNNVKVADELSWRNKLCEEIVLATQIENTIIVEDQLSVGSSATIASCNKENPSNFLEFTRTNHNEKDDEHMIVSENDDLSALLFKGSDGKDWVQSAKIYSEADLLFK